MSRLAIPASPGEHPSPGIAPALSQADARRLVVRATEAISSVLRGHGDAVRLVLAAILARGHVLLEDVPGVGKTTLARTVAKVLGGSFARIQFTADMLPADVLGVQVLDPRVGTFSFRRGPIFAEVVLADEINRASPKTQSAMLEAMGEGRVTIDDASYKLPDLFSVLATQNPVEHHGAYPLPESQLDRFMIRVSLGYPPADDERALVLNPDQPGQRLADLGEVLAPSQVTAVQALVRTVKMSDPVADYLLALVNATRRHGDILLGCSPRGSVALAAMARAWAFVGGRDHVLPDDIKDLVVPVLAHRLMLAGPSSSGRQQAHALLAEITQQVAVPR
jgi:MoxR-like ATPase